MKSLSKALPAAALAVGLASSVFGVNVVSNDKMSLNIGGKFQALGVLTVSGDTNANNPNYVGGFKDNVRPYLGLKMGRLNLNGTFAGGWKYNMEMTFGPETSVDGKSSGAFVFLDLLDASVDIPLFDKTFIRAGQYKVPFSQEGLIEDSSLSSVDYSFAYNIAVQGRDVGFTLALQPSVFQLALSTFVGAGRNIPERYLPTKVGIPLLSARIGIDTGIDQDVLTANPLYAPVEKTAIAFHVNGMYEKDSRVGHGGMFSQKKADAPLLMQGVWNRYVNGVGGTAYFSDYLQAGFDFTFKTPIEKNTLALQLEGNYALYVPSNFVKDQTNISMMAGRAQVVFSTEKVDFGLRYSITFPDARFPMSTGNAVATNKLIFYNGATAITNATVTTAGDSFDATPIHELTPSVTWRPTDFFRVIVDAPLYFNMIRTYENGNGPYVIGDMPGQVSTIGAFNGGAWNYYERVFVPELRVVAQLNF